MVCIFRCDDRICFFNMVQVGDGMRSGSEIRARLKGWRNARRRMTHRRIEKMDDAIEIGLCDVAIKELRWVLGSGGEGE